MIHEVIGTSFSPTNDKGMTLSVAFGPKIIGFEEILLSKKTRE